MATTEPIGLAGLIQELRLEIQPPAVRSEAGPTSRRREEGADWVLEVYPNQYLSRTVRDNLRFALRYEPMDLRVWQAVIPAIDAGAVVDWVKQQPTSAFARRAWYLYERLSGQRLPLDDLAFGSYVNLADPRIQITWRNQEEDAPRAQRYRVRNNLLGPVGAEGYCPLIRLSHRLKEFQQRDFAQRVKGMTAGLDPALLARAAEYLYLNETKSSYALEGERPTADREERFVEVLARAGEASVVDKAGLVELQRRIVQDARFAASDWRTIQNYVGRTRLDFSEEVAYPCPKPEDLEALMSSWTSMFQKILNADRTDAVALAACASFAFVYIHPFEDGNGRIHRFIIHHALARLGYTTPGVIFPVSAAILRRRREYEQVLDSISRYVRSRVEFTLDDENRMTVAGNTIDLYRYPDLTPHAEFLYECIAETVEKDWPEELRFLLSFDAAFRAVQSVVDMPDTRIHLLVRLLMQNHGQLSGNKRDLFSFLTDGEIAEIQTRIQAILANPPLPASETGAD
jgi:hypothetical protein